MHRGSVSIPECTLRRPMAAGYRRNTAKRGLKGHRPAAVCPRRLHCEVLEERCLLSASPLSVDSLAAKAAISRAAAAEVAVLSSGPVNPALDGVFASSVVLAAASGPAGL